MQDPFWYKTQNGLLKAISVQSEKLMTVKLARWFQNAEHALIDIWGWDEVKASKYISHVRQKYWAWFL